MVEGKEVKKRLGVMSDEEIVKHALEFDEGVFERFKRKIKAEGRHDERARIKYDLIGLFADKEEIDIDEVVNLFKKYEEASKKPKDELNP